MCGAQPPCADISLKPGFVPQYRRSSTICILRRRRLTQVGNLRTRSPSTAMWNPRTSPRGKDCPLPQPSLVGSSSPLHRGRPEHPPRHHTTHPRDRGSTPRRPRGRCGPCRSPQGKGERSSRVFSAGSSGPWRRGTKNPKSIRTGTPSFRDSRWGGTILTATRSDVLKHADFRDSYASPI